MSSGENPRLNEAKAKPVTGVLHVLKISNLRETPNKREMCGPCPQCGSAGHNPKSGPVDRFNINLDTGAFFCRQCDIRGGDVVALVQCVEGGSFLDALSILCGERPVDETPAQRQAREKRQANAQREVEAQKKKQDEKARWFKQTALRHAKNIWQRSVSDTGPVSAYLKCRGIDDPTIALVIGNLRFVPDLPYDDRPPRKAEVKYSGPAMLARMVGPDGRGQGVHRTWLDPLEPKGKAIIRHDGEVLKSKKTRGSTKGAAIQLHTPKGADTLVMGEGIETTLTAMVANPFPNAAYWAGVDLGNMAGRMQRIKGQRYSGLPDMSDTEAFVPPRWVKRLFFIMDGDSEAKMTRAKLESGLRRAMALRPGLEGRIVHAGDGVDLNDVLVGRNERLS